jgi:hypothetical protein
MTELTRVSVMQTRFSSISLDFEENKENVDVFINLNYLVSISEIKKIVSISSDEILGYYSQITLIDDIFYYINTNELERLLKKLEKIEITWKQ